MLMNLLTRGKRQRGNQYFDPDEARDIERELSMMAPYSTNYLKNLDLSKYVIGYDKYSYKYDLYGICNHSGGTEGGHYYAYVKNANGKWYEFNDANVQEFTNLDKLKSPYAYCFFYRKQKIE